MFGFIKKIRERQRKERLSRIEFCLEGSDITMTDLEPLQKEDYSRLCSSIRMHLGDQIENESGRLYQDVVMPDGRVIHSFPVENIFAWREVVRCLEWKGRDAYHVKGKKHDGCGEESMVLMRFRSSDESWKSLCGREGYMLICPQCMKQVGFKCYLMN